MKFASRRGFLGKFYNSGASAEVSWARKPSKGKGLKASPIQGWRLGIVSQRPRENTLGEGLSQWVWTSRPCWRLAELPHIVQYCFVIADLTTTFWNVTASIRLRRLRVYSDAVLLLISIKIPYRAEENIRWDWQMGREIWAGQWNCNKQSDPFHQHHPWIKRPSELQSRASTSKVFRFTLSFRQCVEW